MPTNQKEDEFIERLRVVLNKMDVEDNKKECILELIEMQLKHPPTSDKDIAERYRAILEYNAEKKG
tara:strand:+ start:1045 stop:1242 length:198 start_codon:yes stop_codon:yes gene_type:complete